MPTLTTTIEDTSPVIVYSGGSNGSDWVAGTSALDKYTDQYSQSSFMVTQTLHADMSFYFYGTGVQLYGAKRQNHGQYQISIDSVVYTPVNGSTPDPGIFQTSLFSTVALKNGYHTVRMTNLESSYLDLDFITWQTPVGEPDEQLIATTVQDTDPSFVYTPEDQWNSGPSNVGMFSGGSGHITSTPGASVEYTFMGDSVALYGPVGPSGAPYSVQLNNNAAKNFSSWKQFYRPQTMLFQASNLGSGQHSVKLRSEAWNNYSALSFAIDYAQVYTTSSLQKSSGSESGLSKGAIGGIATGAVLALLALIVLFWRLRPSKFKKIFHLKGRSNKNQTVAEAFEYHPIGSTLSNASTTTGTHVHGLTTQTSPSISQSPPSTSLWPNSGGGSYAPPADAQLPGPNTQVITLPYTPDGKYRPDLVQAPQLMSPPRRLNPTDTQLLSTPQSSSTTFTTSQYQQLRPNRSHPNFATAALPEGRQPVPGVSLDDLRGAAGRAAVQEPGLSPVRRPTNNVTFEATSPSPPRYERNP